MQKIEKEKEQKGHWLAPQEIKDLVDELYAECRKDLEGRPNIVCLFRAKAPYSAGKVAIGSIKRISEKENIIHAYYEGHEDIHYVLELSADIWPSLTDVQKEAVLVHELYHIDQKITGDDIIKWSIRRHQIEEFSPVVQKYGFYMTDIKDFAEETKEAASARPTLKSRMSNLKVVGGEE